MTKKLLKLNFFAFSTVIAGAIPFVSISCKSNEKQQNVDTKKTQSQDSANKSDSNNKNNSQAESNNKVKKPDTTNKANENQSKTNKQENKNLQTPKASENKDINSKTNTNKQDNKNSQTPKVNGNEQKPKTTNKANENQNKTNRQENKNLQTPKATENKDINSKTNTNKQNNKNSQTTKANDNNQKPKATNQPNVNKDENKQENKTTEIIEQIESLHKVVKALKAITWLDSESVQNLDKLVNESSKKIEDKTQTKEQLQTIYDTLKREYDKVWNIIIEKYYNEEIKLIEDLISKIGNDSSLSKIKKELEDYEKDLKQTYKQAVKSFDDFLDKSNEISLFIMKKVGEIKKIKTDFDFKLFDENNSEDDE
ncbi:hypothetical protein NPA07_01260 [Mycoplasmopsis caviae]|uniref:Lipoprotein n=1 Tax=Mycoplasmopsis caviae TaxID=55603 RepID=A0A3P8KWG1_9BACT|nr:hypothetical protein [Mycoplasmopsis caviae]UUD35486.1 hypothetical protein NPA07_01260 [Mycoplasmopsis caviae]VDR41737.1 Uncharacterised protein [Mycoplasmopsis caviae]